MKRVLAIYGSPRKDGTTSVLLGSAVKGAEEAGVDVEQIFLRDIRMSPCLELYACRSTGRCAIRDGFQALHEKLLACDALMLATPVFFYTVSAHTKIFMDRCQAQWASKYLVDRAPFGIRPPARQALFLCAGATHGAKLFDGILLTMKFFLDAFDMELHTKLLYRGLESPADLEAHPEFLKEAFAGGGEFARVI